MGAGRQDPHLVYIGRAGNRYTLSAPPAAWDAVLSLEGTRLVFREMQLGREVGREVLWLTHAGAELDWGSYVAPPFDRAPDAVVRTYRATGSRQRLAHELANWHANEVIEQQVSILSDAIDLWREDYGSGGKDCFPPRSTLLPDGAFWRWSDAPHLRNAITGMPMILGKGPGNFDYKTNGTRSSYVVGGHLYGGGDWTVTRKVGL